MDIAKDNRNHYWLSVTKVIDKEKYSVYRTINEYGKQGVFYHYHERSWKGGVHGAEDDTVEFGAGFDAECLIEIVAIATDRINSHDGEMEIYYNHVWIKDSVNISIRQYRESAEMKAISSSARSFAASSSAASPVSLDAAIDEHNDPYSG